MNLHIVKTMGVHVRLNIRASKMTQWNGKPKFEPSYRSAYESMKVVKWEYQNLIHRLLSSGMDEKETHYKAMFS